MFIFYNITTKLVEVTTMGKNYPPQMLEDGLAVIEADLPQDTDFAGWQVIDGVLVHADLGPSKRLHLDKVRACISEVRSAYITTLPGQDIIYLLKQGEAVAYLAATDPDIADYPMLASEVGVTAPTAYELAQVWLYMAQQWQALATMLERARMLVNASILEAETQSEIEGVYKDFKTAMSGFL